MRRLRATCGRKDGTRRPGCNLVLDGPKEVDVRLTNPDAEGMSLETRVENEVAMNNLAAAALRGFGQSVVPSTYAWGRATTQSSQGWNIQALMPGEPVDKPFAKSTSSRKA